MNAKLVAAFVTGAILGGAVMRWIPPPPATVAKNDAERKRGPVFPRESPLGPAAPSGARPAPIQADPDAPAGSPEALLAAAEQFDADLEREGHERAANDRSVWSSFYEELLGLSAEQMQTLKEMNTPGKMTGLLQTPGYLNPGQTEKLQEFQKERSLNYSEITAQKQMAWVQEHLPLTTPQKDRLWQVLSDHALALTEAGGDFAKRGELIEKLSLQIKATMSPAAAGVALSYLESGMEDAPPGMETEPEAEAEEEPDAAAEDAMPDSPP